MTAFPKPVKRPPKPRKPLKRSWIKAKPPRRLSRAGSLPEYLAWLRKQPCACSDGRCSGRVEVSHLRDHTGIGRKAPDYDAIPKCRSHHRAWEERRLPFNWSQETRVLWFRSRAIEYATMYHLQTGRSVLPQFVSASEGVP